MSHCYHALMWWLRKINLQLYAHWNITQLLPCSKRYLLAKRLFREARDDVKLVVEALLACSLIRDVFRWQGAWIVCPETLAYLLEINIEVSATLPEASLRQQYFQAIYDLFISAYNGLDITQNTESFRLQICFCFGKTNYWNLNTLSLRDRKTFPH